MGQGTFLRKMLVRPTFLLCGFPGGAHVPAPGSHTNPLGCFQRSSEQCLLGAFSLLRWRGSPVPSSVEPASPFLTSAGAQCEWERHAARGPERGVSSRRPNTWPMAPAHFPQPCASGNCLPPPLRLPPHTHTLTPSLQATSPFKPLHPQVGLTSTFLQQWWESLVQTNVLSDLCSREQVPLIMRTWKKEGPFCLSATARIPHPGPSVRSQRLILQGLQSNLVFVLWGCFHFKGFTSESRESFLEPSGVSMVTGLSGPEGSQHSLHFATSSSFLPPPHLFQ